MKSYPRLNRLFFAILVVLTTSCGAGRNSNTGTASDRTGNNGATNGNGKAPSGNAHQQTTRP